jgi:hypothetical protein
MRTIDTAISVYRVDNNSFPTGWDINVGGRANAHSLFLLSTPIAYITTGDLQDPFVRKKKDQPMWTTYLYDPMTIDGRMFSQYHIDIGHVRRDEPAPWWLLISVGPDKKSEFTYNPSDGVGVEWATSVADTNPVPFLNMIYDPTNGTVSRGNIWRAGGGSPNAAGRMVMAANR